MRSRLLTRLGCTALSALMVVSLAGCGAPKGGSEDKADQSDREITDVEGEQGADSADDSGSSDQGVAEKIKIDDFYLYANEEWLDAVELESTEPSRYRNDVNTEKLYDRLEELLSNANPEDFDENDPMYKMVTLYDMCADPERREGEAMDSLKAMTDHVRNVKNVKQLQEVMNDSEYSLFNNICYVFNGITSGAYYLPQVTPKPMYELYSSISASDREKLALGIKNEFMVLGYSEEEAEKIAENVNAFDEHIHEFLENTSGAIYSYTEEAWDEFNCTVDVMDILKANDYYITDRFGDVEYVFFTYEDYADWLSTYVTDANIEMVTDYYAFCILDKLDILGSRELIAASTSGTCLVGGAEMKTADDIEDYEYPVSQVIAYDEGAIAAYYASLYITDDMISEMQALLDEIIYGYREIFDNIDWLDKRQHNRICAKTALATYQYGCYDEYNHLEDMVVGDGIIDTVISLLKSNRRFSQRMLVEHMLDEDNEYIATSNMLYQVNAYYDYESHSVTICLGYFTDDYLWTDASYEEKMAILGSVITHELSHSCDSRRIGFRNDATYDDNWDDYWTQYNYSIEKLYNYYNGMKTDCGAEINGYMVVNESTADILSMQAMMATLEAHGDVDYDLFFRSYAMFWGGVMRPEAALFMNSQDTHMPNHERVNSVLAQLDKFYEIYDVDSNSDFYLDKADRITIFEYVEE